MYTNEPLNKIEIFLENKTNISLGGFVIKRKMSTTDTELRTKPVGD